MYDWEWEDIEGVINDKTFRIIDAGPLHSPITSFSLKRTEELGLILTTSAPGHAKSAVPPPVTGTVRYSTHTVQLSGPANYKATLRGVDPTGLRTTFNTRDGSSELHQTAIVHWAEVSSDDQEPSYVIDWFENVRSSPFFWPHSVTDKNEGVRTRTVDTNNINDDLAISSKINGGGGGSRTCVSFTIDGVQMYLCALDRKGHAERRHPGCIVYRGTPDETFREKIRTSVSFSLGTYLVHLGSSSFSDQWHPTSFKGVSAYSLALRAFDFPALPPAPLGERYVWEINPQMFTRAVKAIYDNYDMLQFTSLSWQYWHALCATMHIAGVHFGAAIEALKRAYVEAHRDRFQTALIRDKSQWKGFARPILATVATLPIPENIKRTLKNKVGGLNEPPVRMMIEQLVKEIGITISEEELNAWGRRNMAAHGHHPEYGKELQIIRDTKLLQVLFHRMLLRMTNASDTYHDYCSANMPIRRLADPPPPMSTVATK
jgi:hypothetical protein